MLAADFPTTAGTDAGFPADEQSGFAVEVYSAAGRRRCRYRVGAFDWREMAGHLRQVAEASLVNSGHAGRD